jgi:amino acid adenylation domain-containing protein/non-ribosomal peptide synthase protein (TIGR01720 family)
MRPDWVNNHTLATLVELLSVRASGQASSRGYVFLADGEAIGDRLSYADLDKQARAIAASIQGLAARGERVLLLYPPGLEFISGFFGSLYAGMVAVPAYPPEPGRLERTLPRLQSVAADAQASLILTTSSILPAVDDLVAYAPSLRQLPWVATDAIDLKAAADWQESVGTVDTVAFLQYTSGSTGTPKAVILTHGNLLHNAAVIDNALEHQAEDRYISWLPTFHDMGFMAGVLQPLYAGLPAVLMSPVAFLQRPVRWLQAITRYGGTISGGPNFAYDLCVRKVSRDDLSSLDLRGWRVAFNGAEPVRAETLERFTTAFSDCGFRPEAFYPCYGLAEATLMVTGGPKESKPLIWRADPGLLEMNTAREAGPGDNPARRFVSCGRPLPEQRVVLVNPESLTECADEQVGEIWVAGPGVAKGYWNRPEDTSYAFEAHLPGSSEESFLRTGDLGFRSAGHLYVTSRLKDLIIIRGRNHYPQDIEITVERSHASLRPGCGAAFSVEGDSEERLVIVQELEELQHPDLDLVIEAIRQAVAVQHELEVFAVALLKRGSVPKTSSGKIQRHLCRKAFLNGGLEAVALWEAHPASERDMHNSLDGRLTASSIADWLRSRLAVRFGADPLTLDPDQSLHRYGLDSLASIELSHQVETALGIKLPISGFLKGCSINELSASAISLLNTSEFEAPLRNQSEVVEYPLSHGQRGLWFLCQLDPDSATYAITRAVRIRNQLDAPALRRAFQALINRHRALRTTFPVVDGQPVARVAEHAEVVFRREDASSYDEAKLDARLVHEARRPFDLAKGPLLRIHLFRRAEGDYVLFLSIHHIISDFWSLAVLFDELGTAYDSEKRGVAPAFYALDLEYSDYVSWQTEMLAGRRGEQLREYWRKQLSGELPIVNLPANRPRPAVQTYRGASEPFNLSVEEVSALNTFGRKRGATLYVTLLAAFQALLHRYTAQNEIIVGSPTAGRIRAGLERVIGYFVNPVALLADFSGDPSFDDYLSQIRHTVLSGFDHQEYPFPLLVDELQAARDPGRSPVFQIMFVLQKSHLPNAEDLAPLALGHLPASLDLAGLRLQSVNIEQRVTQFDITLAMAEVRDGIAGSLEYNSDLFEAPTIVRMAGHFKTLVSSSIIDPGLRISHLRMLTESESRELTAEPKSEIERHTDVPCIHRMFEAQVERIPDAVAAVFEQQQTTYLELDQRANKLARYLRTMGAGPETFVAVCLERELETVTSLLAILKAGAAYVPLDPAYPAERLAYMLEDSGASLLLTSRRLLDSLPANQAKIICIDDDRDAISSASPINDGSSPLPGNPAYMIYTSGSTGAPKGVIVTHFSVTRLLESTHDWFQFDDRDTWTLFHSYAFDFSVWELWGCLAYGGRLVLVPYWVSRSPELFHELLCLQRVTVLNQTPSAFRQLMLAEQDIATRASLPLRLVIFGGESLDVQSLGPWFERHGDRTPALLNMYGITETTVHVTYRPMSNNDLTAFGRGTCGSPAGRPLPEWGVSLLDEQLQPVPVGIAGQMYVSGAGLARGYARRPDLTADRFIPNPFGSTEGARMYRSGDLARYSKDGDLQYLGRIDQQVKVRGFRIELGEIESIIRQHPAVADAAVLPGTDGQGERQLIGYVVPGSGPAAAVRDLREFLSRKLPDYMLPSAFVMLERLPLTPNGKLDRRALPAPEKAAARTEGDFEAARTTIEETLTGIWADVLGVDRVGISDDFFELGGDSIISIQVVSRARRAGLLITPRQLFEHHTIAELARAATLLEPERSETALQFAASSPPHSGTASPDELLSASEDVECVYPLSPMQQGMLFHTLYAPESGVYCTQLMCDLDGRLDARAFGMAWQRLIDHHAVLRTAFEWERVASPVQVVRKRVSLSIDRLDWSDVSPEKRREQFEELLASDRRLGFRLDRPPLMRLTLVRIGDDKHRVLWSCHHLLMDGWSLPIALKEVFGLYDVYADGKDPDLEDSRPFRDYVLWLQRQDPKTAESFWRNTLRGFAEPNLFPMPGGKSSKNHGYSERQIVLSADRTEALKAAARKHQVTLNTVAQGAWALVVGRYSGWDDVVYGTVSSGRPAEIDGIESMIGLFINTLPVRVKIDYGQPPITWLRELQGTLADVRQYEYSGLAEVQAWSDVPRGMQLFETIFVFENYPLDPTLFQLRSGLKISDIRPIEQTNYPLTMAVVPGDRLGFYMAYDTDRFDEAAIDGLLSDVSNLMEALIVDQLDHLSQLPAIAPSFDRLPRILNDTRVEYAADRCVHELFEAQAERNPDTIALVFDDDRLTYAGLDAASNRLARHLCNLGLKPGDKVGVCLHRSIDLIVAVLAVLKAGTAYVPIEPELPGHRRQFMLEDSRITVLLTERELADQLVPCPARPVFLGKLQEEWHSVLRESSDKLNGHAAPQDLAYVIYTSGSTGRPKGVMIGHRSLSNHLQWMQSEFPIGETDSILQKYSISFDTSILEILYPLLGGAALVIAKPDGQHDIRYLAELLETQAVTAIDVVPSMLRALLDCQQIKRSSLRRVTCGGETLDSELKRRFYECLPKQELANLYGPTETTISATYFRCEAGIDGLRVPIGRPIANTQVHILNGRAERMPVGAPGEVYVGGDGLAWGYLNNSSLTAERFVPDHLSAESGARLYRTGDLGQYRADGSIEFLGRKDDQVKVRGFRIEPGEIEIRLNNHPQIAASVVVAQDGIDREKRLAAYVVGRGRNAPSATELRRFLGEELPEYMIPAAFVMLDELPLTPSGKIDKRALPRSDVARLQPDREYVPPRSVAEKRLAEVWADVLGLERVGIHDNFFDLGGDSIISIQIIARARQFGIEFTPKHLFENPTVAGVAQVAKLSRAMPAEQAAVTGKSELTPIQRWFFESDIVDQHHNNQAVMLEVSRDAGYFVLERALAALVAHHDALRLRFVRGHEWEQEYLPAENNEILTRVDLSEIQDHQAEQLEQQSTEVQRSLSLEKGQIIRAVYFDLGPAKPARLLIVIHHLAVDVVSWRILLEDLQAACEQLRRGQEINLAPKTTSFKEWAALLSTHARSGARQQELDYWLHELSREVYGLPADCAGGSNTVGSAASVHVALSIEETRTLLQEVLAASRAQINEVLLTALAQAFSMWTGRPRLLIDLEGHGREEIIEGIDLSRTVGWFTTIFPVLLDIGRAATAGEALRLVKQKLRTVPDRGIGYGLLRYITGDEAARTRLAKMQAPQVSFNYLGQLDRTLARSSAFALAAEPAGPSRSERAHRSHVIEIDASVVGGRLEVEWSYGKQIHSPQTIERFAGEFIQRLRVLIENALSGALPAYVTSDFPLANLDQQQLDRWALDGWKVEDVYPATPTQEGLIFHTQLSPDSGAYCTQMLTTLAGDLDVAAFRYAWRCIVDRHAVLRTAFVALPARNLLQVVHRLPELSLAYVDLQSIDRDTQQVLTDDYLDGDRRKAFDSEEPPLMRLLLMRSTSDEYRFVWTSHHTLLDGWCIPVILREALSLYEAFRRGERRQVNQPRPYRDYIAWLKRQDLVEAELFWRRMLGGFREPTRLTPGSSTDGSGRQESLYEEQYVRLSIATTEDLNRSARRRQITPSTLVHAAWALLLSRYTGEEDIAFGTVLSGRPPELLGVESMIGLFINTLPIRVRVPAERKFLPWLKELQDLQTELRQYEYSPLVQVQTWSDVRNGQPLFETILVFENYPVDQTLDGPNWSLEISAVRTIERTNYPITVAVIPEQELSIQVTYDCSTFDRSVMARLLGHLTVLLEAMASGADYRLSELPLLTPPEKDQLLVEWNDTKTDYGEDRCIHQLFEEQAAERNDAIAVLADEEQITFGGLNRRANQLARYLQNRHLQPEGTVGLFLDRGVAMVTAILGTLKAGGAYVPLDPEYPAERTRFVLDDSNVHAVVTTESLRAKLPVHRAETVSIDNAWEEIAAEGEAKPAVQVLEANPAYLMYTSGSTGQPKGAIGLHGGTVNRFRWMWRRYPFEKGEICCQKTSMSFGDSVWEVFGPLAAGIPIVVIPPDDVKDPMRLAQVLDEKRMTRIVLVPSLLSAILDSGDDVIARRLAGVKYWVCSGEALPGELQERFRDTMPGNLLLNLYGSSEISADATSCEVGPASSGSNTPIGRPIANTQSYIVDRNMEPVPIGVGGELYIGGNGLGRGYLNRPDLTAGAFVPNPFGKARGSTLYRTGDLARYREDGEIEFLGRRDHQVKIRGFRIELGEIEAILREHPAVEQVVVTAHDDAGRRRLVAYFVAGENVCGNRLKDYLQARLPEYMVPSAFVGLDRMPLTASGKIDRRALPRPEMGVDQRGRIDPGTAVEEIVCGICAEVLGLARVGADADFFELGGHSLLATQVVSRIRKLLGAEIGLRALFANPTAAALAAEVETAYQGRQQNRPPAIKPSDRAQPLPLSFAQLRLWLIDQIDPATSAYNIPVALRLEGFLHLEVLHVSMSEIVRRHEVLRTCFPLREGSPVQQIDTTPRLDLMLTDLSGLEHIQREELLTALIAKEAELSFDLARPPLIRARVLRLAGDEHLLLVTMHHIISDGWSMQVMIRELADLYSAYQAGATSPMAELDTQYADFALWQRDWLTGQVLDTQIQYWKTHLAGLAVLDLPADRPRPTLASYRAASIDFLLPLELTCKLKDFSRRQGVTLFMSTLAAFQVLLSRYTGQQDIAVGCPIAGRNRHESERLIGFFVNTLVMRTDLSGNPTAAELLRRVRETALGAYAHQDLPFEKLVEELQPERSLGHQPLVQVMFSFQNVPEQEFHLPRLTITPEDVDTGAAKYDLTLFLREEQGELQGMLEYAADLFDSSRMVRLIGHLQRLLEGMAQEQRVLEMALISEQERGQLLYEWNRTAADYPAGKCPQELFEEQVEQRPETVAVVYEHQQVTYRQLNRRANQIAHYLRMQGVQADDQVGLCLQRSVEMVTAMLGILKAGAAYVPLDPAYPTERLALILEDTGSRVLLTQTSLAGLHKGHCGEVVRVDGDWDAIARQPDEDPKCFVDSSALAYVIYTSGSTGKPKGVCIQQRSITRLVFNTNYIHLGPSDVVAQVSNSSFDAATFEIWGALLHGGRLTIIHKHRALSPVQLALRVDELAVTAMFLTTAAFNQLARTCPAGLSNVDTVLFGGEAVDPGCVARVLAAGSPARLINVYGPTESTTFATWHPVQAGGEPICRVPIGKPLSNTRTYILDSQSEPVPLGVPGQLYIAGDGLARAYHNAPELTAERFLPEPFVPQYSGRDEAGRRMYRTGDIVRHLEDGSVEFIGRSDYQVKIRGFRIEPGEIEFALRQNPMVADAAVTAGPDFNGDRRLAAYVVAKEPVAPSRLELRTWLKEKLPDYLVPSVFVFMEALPLNPNGKVDRRALPPPQQGALQYGSLHSAPHTPIEAALAEIFAEVLGVPQVGIDADFFELGGHSLLATQVVSRIRKLLGVGIGLRTLFANPTVAALAAEVETPYQGEPQNRPPAIKPADRAQPLALSFAQMRLWLIDQIDPATSAYNIPVALRLKGFLHPEPLRASISEIVRRHEVLRTCFPLRDGCPVQQIDSTPRFDLRLTDLSGLQHIIRGELLGTLIPKEGAVSFDLARPPLIRASLLRLRDDEHLLLVTMHHIISDGWSMQVMIRELAELYSAYRAGASSPMAELDTQYADFALWQRDWLTGQVLDTHIQYWKNHLAGLGVLELPADGLRPTLASYRAASIDFPLPLELTSNLKDLSRRQGVTLFMSMLAGFQVLLSRYTGQQDIAVGCPIAGRNRHETERLIGFFVNTLVMRTDLSGNPTAAELLQRVRETALGAYAHQDLPFEKLVEELQPDRSPGHQPLVQVMFSFQNVPEQEVHLPGLTTTPEEATTGAAKYDLTLFLREEQGQIQGMLEYAAELFDPSRMARLIGHLQRLLEGMAQGRRVFETSLITEQERDQLIFEWNRTAVDYPAGKCLQELFEEQVEQRPETVAVVYEHQQVTYRQLNRQSNQIAHYLRMLGVQADDQVGLCLQRSVEMVTAMLGILKAGAAYVPLDPTYPTERLALILEDTGAAIVVTDERGAGALPAMWLQVIAIDSAWDAIGKEPEENPIQVGAPENLAYVPYTSGSTGKPKGVGIQHRNIAKLVKTADYAELGADAVMLQFAPISFDASTFEIWGPLLNGGRLVVFPSAFESLEQLGTVLRESQVTTLWLAAGLFHQIVEKHLDDLAHLSRVLAGGEVLSSANVRRVLETLRQCRLINGYGPTEATTFSCCYCMDRQTNILDSVPIGRPVANTRVYILDSSLEPVPIGVAGELYVGGDGLGRGYMNKPDLTAASFAADPFGQETGSRLYRTGDLARYRDSSDIEFLGRTDHQVKIRGFRIELGEIEALLRGHPSVQQAAVSAEENGAGSRRLAAYFVAGQSLDGSRLRQYLQARLPDYMIPSGFVQLDRMPLTASGKIDRRALPKPEMGSDRGEYVAPRNAVEEIVCDICRSVLALERVGVEDDFFELGGHSLLATQVVSRVNEALRVRLSLEAFFEDSTIEGIARAIVANETRPGRTEKIARIVVQVNNMPAEDVERMLREKDLEHAGRPN